MNPILDLFNLLAQVSPELAEVFGIVVLMLMNFIGSMAGQPGFCSSPANCL